MLDVPALEWGERRVQRAASSHGTQTTLGVLGGVGIIAGAWAWLATNATANACTGLVAALAPDQCNRDTTIHTAGAVGFIVGVVLVIIAVVRLR